MSEEEEIDYFGDYGVASYNKKIPKFLILTYIVMPLWGIATLYYFWNGSVGWMDRGSWHELQIAANTTFPIKNQNMLPDVKEEAVSEETRE